MEGKQEVSYRFAFYGYMLFIPDICIRAQDVLSIYSFKGMRHTPENDMRLLKDINFLFRLVYGLKFLK